MPVQKPPVTVIDNFEVVEFSTPPHWGITVALQDVLADPVPPARTVAAPTDVQSATPANTLPATPRQDAASRQGASQQDATPPSAHPDPSPSGGLEKILPSGIASAHLEEGVLVLVPRGGSRAFRRLALARPQSDLWQKVFSESHFTILVLSADGTPVFEQMLRSPQPAHAA